MKKAVLPLILILLSIFFFVRFLRFYPEDKTKIISWKEADKYYGQYMTVEGKIVKTYNSGKACFLNFHENWRKYFSAVIFAKDFHKFPEHPEDYYYLKTVYVFGLVKEYRGKPEIILRNPSQIKIIQN